MKCEKCQDTLWVCEHHMDRPSAVLTPGGCNCGGAACNCSCNPQGGSGPAFVPCIAAVELTEPTPRPARQRP